MSRSTRGRAVAAVAALALASAGLVGCAIRPPANEIVLYYSAGAGENKEFQECVAPGHGGPSPVDDEYFALPTDKRFWNIQPEGGDSNTPITSGSAPGKDGQPGPAMHVWLSTDFYLNWDCDLEANGGKGSADSPVVRFFERTGRTAGLSSSSGGFDLEAWKKLLVNTLVVAERDVLQTATRQHSGDALDGNIGGVYDRIEAEVGPLFSKLLRDKVGGDYFCGVQYDGGKEVTWTERVWDDKTGKLVEHQRKGTCPPVRIDVTNIDFADPGIQDARNRVFKAEQDKNAALIEAERKYQVAVKEAKAKKANPDYTELEIAREQTKQAQACAQSPNCTLVVGGGVGVNVNR